MAQDIVGIPVEPNVPFQRFQVELDAVIYGFEFRWNHRAATWTMCLYDAEGVLLDAGIRLTFGGFLLRTPRPLTLPPGELFLVDARNGAGDPTLETLGTQVELVYLTAAGRQAALSG